MPEDVTTTYSDPPQYCPVCGVCLIYAVEWQQTIERGELWRAKVTVGCEHCNHGLAQVVTQHSQVPERMRTEAFQATRLLYHRIALGVRYVEMATTGWLQTSEEDERPVNPNCRCAMIEPDGDGDTAA